MQELFGGVYEQEGYLYTRNSVTGQRVYDEVLVVDKGQEYRSWNPYKSKLAAAIMNGLQELPVNCCTNILYLGAATGTTVSHLSDIAPDGVIYAVEVAAGAMQKLLLLCSRRRNVVPILGDAGRPVTYRAQVDRADIIYQDIAQRDQVDIFCKNMELFQPRWGIMMVKARSIDVGRAPRNIFSQVEYQISQQYDLCESISLAPYSKDHRALLLYNAGLDRIHLSTGEQAQPGHEFL